MVVPGTDGWIYQVRTRTVPSWQKGFGHEVEAWLADNIGARGVAWEISFGRIMFRQGDHASLFQLTWW